MKKLLAAAGIATLALVGLGSSPALACDDGANTPTKYSLPNPVTGGTIWYSTNQGTAGVTVVSSDGQDYIEARQDPESGDVEVGGNHSDSGVHGQVNSSNPTAVCTG